METLTQRRRRYGNVTHDNLPSIADGGDKAATVATIESRKQDYRQAAHSIGRPDPPNWSGVRVSGWLTLGFGVTAFLLLVWLDYQLSHHQADMGMLGPALLMLACMALMGVLFFVWLVLSWRAWKKKTNEWARRMKTYATEATMPGFGAYYHNWAVALRQRLDDEAASERAWKAHEAGKMPASGSPQGAGVQMLPANITNTTDPAQVAERGGAIAGYEELSRQLDRLIPVPKVFDWLLLLAGFSLPILLPLSWEGDLSLVDILRTLARVLSIAFVPVAVWGLQIMWLRARRVRRRALAIKEAAGRPGFAAFDDAWWRSVRLGFGPGTVSELARGALVKWEQSERLRQERGGVR